MRETDNQTANKLFFFPFALLIFGKRKEEEKREKQVDSRIRELDNLPPPYPIISQPFHYVKLLK